MKNKELVELLIKKKWHVASAESCTGGLFAAGLIDIADASKVINESYVTYSEGAKEKLVFVKPETIKTYNVVSEEVAGEMAIGAAKQSGAEVSVGITGIAGPSGGTKEIPVGTVCFGFYVNGEVTTITRHFTQKQRNEVRFSARDYAYEKLIELINLQ
ncbi:MAG: CinA family protein [Lachnospiraceae bacterium]|nr:CinA family protein [Lachnospiraceae bacterium]